MANSTENNGNQTITFRYQQEGTAETFNKILHGLTPRGIISGGLLKKISDSENDKIYIDPMQLLIGDSNVTAHVETSENAEVNISTNKPYVVGTYTWMNMNNSYVNFESMALSEIQMTDNVIVFGKCVFNGYVLKTFDYTKRTWCPSHYRHDFGWENFYNGTSPSFNVTPKENPNVNEYEFLIEAGEAIINGIYASFTGTKTLTLQQSDSQADNYFISVIPENFQRNDLIVLETDNQGNITPRYIMGTATNVNNNSDFPLCPSGALAIAMLHFDEGTYTTISGDKIKYLYNSNFYGGSPVVGKKVGSVLTHPHTLYL